MKSTYIHELEERIAELEKENRELQAEITKLIEELELMRDCELLGIGIF